VAAANRRFALHPMTRDELDRYIAEVAVVGEHTGVEAPPRSWAELLASLERHRPNLAVAVRRQPPACAESRVSR